MKSRKCTAEATSSRPTTVSSCSRQMTGVWLSSCAEAPPGRGRSCRTARCVRHLSGYVMSNDQLLHRLGIALCVLFWLLLVTAQVSADETPRCDESFQQRGGSDTCSDAQDLRPA